MNARTGHAVYITMMLTSGTWALFSVYLGSSATHRHRDEIQQLERRLETCEDGAEDLPRLLRAEERRLNEREANFR